MSPEILAIATLITFAAIAVLVVVWQTYRSGIGWRLYLLYFIERLYVPLVFHRRANSRCPLPADGPAIVVANHRSPVDPLMLWLNVHLGNEGRRPIRRIHFLMAREYLDVPIIGWMCRQLEVIPLERTGRDLAPAKEALQLLKEDQWVGIFPEGRLNRGTDLLEGDTGVAWLALHSKAPVYPAFIHDSPQGGTMVAPFRTLSRVRVTFGEPIDLSEYYGKRKTRELLQEVTDLMMTRLADLGGVGYPGSEPADVLPMDDSESRRATG